MDASEQWNRTFSQLDEHSREDPWLERWRGMLDTHRGSPILDLGCGAGYETRTLTDLGYSVVAADFSEKALQLTRRRAPEAKALNLDLTRPLSFPDEHFGAVVASLSLHYFPWHQTVRILEEVRRCLVPGGHLLARLNSKSDAHYAAQPKEEIEPNFYLVRGHPKRLFDHADIETLFSPNWTLEHATEQTTTRYGSEKTLWEVVAKKHPEANS